MSNHLFDLSDEYDQMLNKGLRLSGEGRRFFLEGRVDFLLKRLPSGRPWRRILDYGCGLGETSACLARRFPEAEVVGVDTSPAALKSARRQYGSDRVTFSMLEELDRSERFDLCYCNGVFHHIPVNMRPRAVELVHRVLCPGGTFAFFENNPWNPGTRLVMRLVPFDRDAIMISPARAVRMLRSGGFSVNDTPDYLFIFPKVLAALRPLEPKLVKYPFGAQYLILSRKGTGGYCVIPRSDPEDAASGTSVGHREP
ncbi:MAG: class I SAM-dependent methyltransferase [Magnetococcales bacterium]|nr:class I SAM-dependent methyltransferase [Magnetococcales bacterium]